MNEIGLHPSCEELEGFGLGRLDAEAAAEVHGHLERCGACRAVVESLPDDTLSALVRASATPADGTLSVGEVAGASSIAALDDVPPDHARYRVLQRIGVGGMGVVYKAQHLLMERTVALKVIHRRLTEKPALVERFRREVKAAAGLNHPNIVTAHDADQAGDQHFLVMEYVEGITLAQLVREQGPLSPEQACEYVRQAALGLQHAHERGLVHRDIKPANILLQNAECGLRIEETEPAEKSTIGNRQSAIVKILDFGLARLGQNAAYELTDPGTVMGTVDFLAPEQADDPHRADIRADIYSLGCTLYFLLTGHAPFPQGSLLEKLKAHAMREPPPLADLCPMLPGGLETVVARMLAKDPARRFQTPAEVARALAPFTAGSGRKFAPAPSRWRRYVRWSAAAAAVLLLIAAVVGYRRATDRGDIVIESDDPDVEVLVKQGGKLVEILDGKTKQNVTLHTGDYTLSLAGDAEGLKMELPPTFVLRRGETRIVSIKRVPPGEITHWKAHNRQAIVALDPAGKVLASAGEDAMIRLWNVSNGRELRAWKAHTSVILNIAFSPDGKTLASCSWDHMLKWWQTESGELRGSVEMADPWFVSFAADGKSLFAGVRTDGKSTLRRVDLETQIDKVVAMFDLYLHSLALNSDGRTFAIGTEGNSKVLLWDTVAEKEGLQFEIPTPSANALDFEPQSMWLAVGGENAMLGLWNVTGNLKVTMSGLKQPVMRVAFSPDGKFLVSGGGAWQQPQGTGEIKVWDPATGKELASLGNDISCVTRVVVAADGRTCYTGHFDGSIYKWRLPTAPAVGKRPVKK